MKQDVMIVDDHPLMREGLALMLNTESNLEVTDLVGSAEEALQVLQKQLPDLLIVDISLPSMNGIELIKQVKALYADQKILVISRHDEQLYAERAIRAGARGYVMKVEARKVITAAVQKVLDGGIFISEAINERLLQSMARGRKSATLSPLEVLSDRELEIFEMIGRGIKSSEIAERLYISVKTVESYRTRIKDKLNLQSATELMQHAIQWVESTAM